MAARARNQNSGQSCIAAKRFIVEEGVADEFGRRFAEAVTAPSRSAIPRRATRTSDRWRAATCATTLERQVSESRGTGAQRSSAASRSAGRGYFYAPTVLDGVTDAMPAFREETFGPVAALIRARDVEHAIALANDTEYGLGAALWTRDLERREGARAPDRGRRRLRQRHGRLRSPDAVRRRQAQRLRSRAWPARHPRVHEHPDRAHRPGRGSRAVVVAGFRPGSCYARDI